MRHFLAKITKGEMIAIDSSISYFLLMFGYKLFSAYFSLYLLQLGFTVAKVGYTYLLIYLPIALCAPFVGYLLHRVRPFILSSLGILGYGVYSIGLLLVPSLFNPLQIILGISAALFLVSTRVIMIRAKLENYDSAFGLFYSAPTYAELVAPVVGGVLILFFGFPGVFIASFGVHLLNIAFSSHRFWESGQTSLAAMSAKQYAKNYIAILSNLRSSTILPLIAIGFTVLIVEGFFGAFFLIFLRNFLGFTQTQVVSYVSVLSLISAFISIFVIRLLNKNKTSSNIYRGGIIYSLAALIMGFAAPVLNFVSVLAVNLLKGFGGLLVSSSRSGLVSRTFSDKPEEAGVIDTMLSPLGTALGAFAGGFIVSAFGYLALFIIGGFVVLISTSLVFSLRKIK